MSLALLGVVVLAVVAALAAIASGLNGRLSIGPDRTLFFEHVAKRWPEGIRDGSSFTLTEDGQDVTLVIEELERDAAVRAWWPIVARYRVTAGLIGGSLPGLRTPQGAAAKRRGQSSFSRV